ncbi:MAG TPA: hypothetical protein VIF34_12190 [Methylocystis sp.]|jgi:hypothetical protein
MSGFDPNATARPFALTERVRSLAAFSAVVFFCSVLGARFLSQAVEKDDLSRLAYERSMRNVARSREQAETQVYSIVRSVGVDGVTTSTIPLRGPIPASPCGDDRVGVQPKK